MPVDASEPGGTHDALSDPRRLAAVQRTGLLDALPGAELDRITRIAAEHLGVPAVLVSLVGGDREAFASAAGAAPAELPLRDSLGRHVVASAAPLVVEDAREAPSLSGSRAVSELRFVAYAGLPLLGRDREVIGAFAAIDHAPRAWREADLARIRDHAALVQAELDRRAARDEAREASALLLRLQRLGGALGIAIGDVVGHGIEAAVEAVRLRNALRGAVLAGRNVPETVLALNAHAAEQPGAHASTLLYLELEAGPRRLRWASAGHVPGVIAQGGRSEWLGVAGGPPLGIMDVETWPAVERTLEPGARVVVFTDGLIERRAEPLDQGVDRIAAVAAEAPDLERLCEAALAQAPSPRFDDLALIALELE